MLPPRLPTLPCAPLRLRLALLPAPLLPRPLVPRVPLLRLRVVRGACCPRLPPLPVPPLVVGVVGGVVFALALRARVFLSFLLPRSPLWCCLCELWRRLVLLPLLLQPLLLPLVARSLSLLLPLPHLVRRSRWLCSRARMPPRLLRRLVRPLAGAPSRCRSLILVGHVRSRCLRRLPRSLQLPLTVARAATPHRLGPFCLRRLLRAPSS